MRSRSCNEYRNTFNNAKTSNRDIQRIYESEKIRYINDTELDIECERINLKSCLNSHEQKIMTYYCALLGIIGVCGAALLLMVIISFNILISTAISVILIIDAAAIIIHLRNTVLKKEIKLNVYYEVCLKVLSELEKDKSLSPKNTAITQEHIL